MARRKKSHKNDLDRLNVLASKLGINVDKLLEEVPLTEFGEEAVIRHQIEAESVLFYIRTEGKGFTAKNCANKRCGLPFLHTYSAVDYCSEECRAWALAQYGIIWNFDRKSDSARWNVKNKGYVPKIIGAAATAALVESGNIFTELPESGVFEETTENEDEYEEEEKVDPSTIIGVPPGRGPVDTYERDQLIAEAARKLVESGEFE
jgi:hypothetical protein